MKKGSFILAIILVVEIIYFFRFNTVFPASIIGWSGTLRWEILVYWIIHTIVIFIILHRFYLQDTISYKSMFTVLLLYLIIRILYDICMYIFLDHKTYGFYFILSKITFFSEIVLQLALLVLLFISAYVKGYRFAFSKRSSLNLFVLLMVFISFIGLNLSMINRLAAIEMIKDTISILSIVTAFAYSLIFEKIINYFMLSFVFRNLKKKDVFNA